MGEIKYPLQIGAIKRNKKVLGVDAKLYLIDDDSTPPLQMHAGYSRMEFSIVDKSLGKVPTANIPADEIPYVMEKTKISLGRIAEGTSCAVENDVSPAYTVKLLDKTFKGKTPAEVLLNNADDKDALIRIKGWLESNLDRYPKNKEQIDAIQEAITLLDVGELTSSASVNNSSEIVVYDSGYKFKNKVNEKNNNLIYFISIICKPNMDYPFELNIYNCYAPVETLPSGQKKIQMNSATDSIKSSLKMTEKEWFNLIRRMDEAVKNFEEMNFEKQFQKALDSSFKH